MYHVSLDPLYVVHIILYIQYILYYMTDVVAGDYDVCTEWDVCIKKYLGCVRMC